MKQNSGAEPSSVLLAGFDEDILSTLAKLVISSNRNSLPDLSSVVILLPGLECAARLRRLLLEVAGREGFPALLGPRIQTLRGWLAQRFVTPAKLNPRRRELLLTEVLLGHPQLYGKGQPWALTRNLAELFDELTLYRGELPEQYAEFRSLVADGYRTGPDKIPEALSREAVLIHTLWQAWQSQLAAEGVLEPATAYLKQLAECSGEPLEDTKLYLAGFHDISGAEAAWLREILQDSRATLLLQGNLDTSIEDGCCHPDAIPARIQRLIAIPLSGTGIGESSGSPLGEFLDSVYQATGAHLLRRAREFATRYPDDPLAGRLLLFAASGRDQEARAVEIQVRSWLLEGRRQIGIVTDNRRLARQIRSLLEQGGVTVDDSAGWALSTTSAAASLERWLQAVEQEFDQQPLLDLLKSPFLFADQPRNQRLSTVYRLERDIIRNGNIARGVRRYRNQLRLRQHHLPHWTRQAAREVEALLDRLEEAAAPLQSLLAGTHSPREMIAALQHSMDLLGMEQAMSDDDAGKNILAELEQLALAAEGSGLVMSWQEFRSWLGGTLEHINFCPPVGGSHVQLLNLSQSGLANFDALVLAGTELDYLPGAGAHSPFFNDSVRLELGLPTRQERNSVRFYLFRRLLQAAPRTLITLRREQDGEPVNPSPWVESLRAFYRLAYRQEPKDGGLSSLVLDPRAAVFRCDTDTLPQPPDTPAPAVPPGLFPKSISASSHQQLVECPYRFFATACLRLAAPEEIREALAKSDYGARVHLCLEAFHSDAAGLPGPFPDPLEPSRGKAAIAMLEQISRKVFARDLEDNFMHRGWLQQWLATIPHYVEWQIRRSSEFQLQEVESSLEIEHSGIPCRLHGRIDRMERTADGIAIVDYKTGRAARRDEVLNGESIQLPFYSMLAGRATGKKVARAEYLLLESKGVKSQSVLEGEELKEITDAVARRLDSMLEEIHGGAALPARGDEICCSHCPMAGVCRRQGWMEQQAGRHD